MATISFSEPRTEVVEFPSMESVSNFHCLKPKLKPPMFSIYQHHSIKMKKTVISISKVEFEERIMKRETLYDKYDKALHVDNELLDSFQFTTLKREVYTELVVKADGSQSIKVAEDFSGIQRSMLLNFRSLPMLRTTRAAMQLLQVYLGTSLPSFISVLLELIKP